MVRYDSLGPEKVVPSIVDCGWAEDVSIDDPRVVWLVNHFETASRVLCAFDIQLAGALPSMLMFGSCCAVYVKSSLTCWGQLGLACNSRARLPRPRSSTDVRSKHHFFPSRRVPTGVEARIGCPQVVVCCFRKYNLLPGATRSGLIRLS